jgi:hypothetical protein
MRAFQPARRFFSKIFFCRMCFKKPQPGGVRSSIG